MATDRGTSDAAKVLAGAGCLLVASLVFVLACLVGLGVYLGFRMAAAEAAADRAHDRAVQEARARRDAGPGAPTDDPLSGLDGL